MYLGLRIAELKTQLLLNELARRLLSGTKEANGPCSNRAPRPIGNEPDCNPRNPHVRTSTARRYGVWDTEDLENWFSLSGRDRLTISAHRIDETRSSLNTNSWSIGTVRYRNQRFPWSEIGTEGSAGSRTRGFKFDGRYYIIQDGWD